MRDYNAEYYDIDENISDDIAFYQEQIPASASVLELGCGSGRVAIPLSKNIKKVVGIDISQAMLERAKKKPGAENIEWIHGDITKAELNRKFDYIIAPFRVLQCLEHEVDIDGFFSVVKNHLEENGKAILNVFNPNRTVEEMATTWIKDGEIECGENVLANGDRLVTLETREKIDVERQVMYPKIIYRRFRGDQLIDEHVNPLCMKFYYPDEFKALLEKQGFKINRTWGGYKGQKFADGPELVIEVSQY